jgi:hypothetical protein
MSQYIQSNVRGPFFSPDFSSFCVRFIPLETCQDTIHIPIAAGLGFSKRVGIENQIPSHKQTEVWDRQCNNSVICQYHQSGHFLKTCDERCNSVSARHFVLDGNLFKYFHSLGWRAHDCHFTDVPWKEHRLSDTPILAQDHKKL